MDSEHIMVELPEGLGTCAYCDNPAKHQIYLKIDPPIKGNPKYGWPDIVGTYCYVCDDHKHMDEGEGE